jgi:hypothetical protein
MFLRGPPARQFLNSPLFNDLLRPTCGVRLISPPFRATLRRFGNGLRVALAGRRQNAAPDIPDTTFFSAIAEFFDSVYDTCVVCRKDGIVRRTGRYG